jgi:hypothetical protein
MACINPNNPIFQNLAKKLGNYMLAEIEFSKLQNEDFIIQNNGTFLNTPEETRKEIFENYVNLMDRKREGKSIDFKTFNRIFNNFQVFKHKSTYIFGEWDSKNNVFKGRLMSSPGIKELYGALDVLFANVDFVASVPSDIGSMLERKGLYKLNVGKEYNFKGEDMVKNLYFSNEKLVEKVFETTPEKVTPEQIKKYDEFFNYHSLISKFVNAYLEYTLNFKQNENLNKDVTAPFIKEINNILKADSVSNDSLDYTKAILFNISNFIQKNPEYTGRTELLLEVLAEVTSIGDKIKNRTKGEKFKYVKNEALIEKLKEAAEKPLEINKSKKVPIQNFNFFNSLKELNIYDYNAYKLARKIKQGRITEDDTQTIITELIKNSSTNKVNIDKTDLLNNPEIYNQLNNDLNKDLATFLSKFGIKTELLENIQDALDIDSFAHVDILNKILYTSKNNQEDYPQQAGKLIAYMMQHNPLVSEIMTDLRKFTKYKGLSKNEMFDAIGDLISEELHKKTNTELPKSLSEKLKILINQFFKYLYDLNFNRVNKNIGFIADNILLQNQSLITSSVFKPGAVGKKVSKISLEEALKSDKFGRDIVEKMAKYFILTGSITLSEQGTVYRPNENQIHDIDWVSSLTREQTIKLFNELYPNNRYIRNISSENYKTDTWLIAPEGYTIENLEYKDEKKVLKNGVAIKTTNKITKYDIVDKDGKVVSSYVPEKDGHTGEIEAKLIDIFSYDKNIKENTASKEITLESGTKLRIADWRNTFAAKLEYGRLKDIWDYNRFIPTDNVYQPLENPNYDPNNEPTCPF